jgi:hypothetical protein
MKPIILLPTIGGHPGGCFRELATIWDEQEYCYVKYNFDIGNPMIEESFRPQARPWWGNYEDVLLYDNTVLDKMSCVKRYSKALFANEVLHGPRESSWIFWARWPRKYFKFINDNKEKKFNDRKIESIFIGNVTTPKRQNEWMNNVSFCSVGDINNHQESKMIFPYEKYIDALSNSKFGLCLPGQGPKCLRETELMGLGTVPIFTPGVSTDYYDKLKENVHYLYANTPSDVKKVILECTNEKWNFISNSCLDWFKRNCSVKGSFDTTVKIVDSLK